MEALNNPTSNHQMTKQPASRNLLDQFKKPEYHNVPFNTLKKNTIYHVKTSKQLHSRYGEKVLLTIKDINSKEIIETFAPDSYIKKCEYQKIDIEESHFFVYRGMETRKRIDNDKTTSQEKYKVHLFDIKSELVGYESDEEL
jgi:hypothetical protein